MSFNDEQERTSVAVSETIRTIFQFMRQEMIARGILLLLFGFLMLSNPAASMLAITILVGVFILIDGVSVLLASLHYGGSGKKRALVSAVGFILLGLVACFSPLLIDVLWVILLGCWLTLSGIQCFLIAPKVFSVVTFAGLLDCTAGALLITSPLLGIITIFWLVGLLLFIGGVAMIITGMRLKAFLK